MIDLSEDSINSPDHGLTVVIGQLAALLHDFGNLCEWDIDRIKQMIECVTHSRDTVEALIAAIRNSPFDLAQCETCGELTLVLPEGLGALCRACAEREAE